MTLPWTLPAAVELRDVGPRDGLQVHPPLPLVDRARLVTALIDAGLREIEVGSFVSPRAVPAMAGTAELLALLGPIPGVTRTALVPNERGARDALAAGADALTVTISASERYSVANTKMTRADGLAQVERICTLAQAAGTPVDVVVSCAFGSPYEGDVAPAEVGRICAAARDAGAQRVTCADTTGMATPARIAAVVAEVGSEIGLHLHETRGTGLVNAWAGLTLGVTRFDCSLGGIGGSPFAVGAAGNVATEELVFLLEDCGVATGVELPALLRASRLLAELVGELPSAVARAGGRSAGA
ncbi:hydroxymethylglutaryl-CoA lyase [Conexibacter stalactiti]|uniref:Hydroxymethylglutaryl-CoA lyase n=1 Tax=Conexibacter stalactiti TaxID=1940611 RepID=A0ABU4HW61_9ACTN|nr:hydroxymethylglutaryl-CoA lyase [Conexibacter stalactiti]MDW5597463.1 hydroxymethylglutaryl-CoA lyase [Conexibacter stalactiti]MEC5038105.1 hydroxymethylglutaryl-CoA lyase [Conexibacter stalactiti]